MFCPLAVLSDVLSSFQESDIGPMHFERLFAIVRHRGPDSRICYQTSVYSIYLSWRLWVSAVWVFNALTWCNFQMLFDNWFNNVSDCFSREFVDHFIRHLSVRENVKLLNVYNILDISLLTRCTTWLRLLQLSSELIQRFMWNSYCNYWHCSFSCFHAILWYNIKFIWRLQR